MFRYVWGYVCLFRFFIFFGGEMSRMCQKQLHLENAQAPRWQKDRSWKAFVWWPFVQEKPWVVRSQARTAYQITTSLRKMGWRCSKRWLLRMLVRWVMMSIYMVYGAWGLLLSGCWGECIGQLPAHTRRICLVRRQTLSSWNQKSKCKGWRMLKANLNQTRLNKYILYSI